MIQSSEVVQGNGLGKLSCAADLGRRYFHNSISMSKIASSK